MASFSQADAERRRKIEALEREYWQIEDAMENADGEYSPYSVDDLSRITKEIAALKGKKTDDEGRRKATPTARSRRRKQAERGSKLRQQPDARRSSGKAHPAPRTAGPGRAVTEDDGKRTTPGGSAVARERGAAWAADVFISYARQDAEVALRLYHGLMKRGFRVWIDQISLVGGQDWKREIHRAIRGSKVFIAVLSNRSVSKRGYVQKELKLGLEVLDEMPPSQIYMIPVRAEPCEPEHERINDLHWVDLFPDFEAGIERVVAALRTVEPA